MKKINKILFTILLIIFSCENPSDENQKSIQTLGYLSMEFASVPSDVSYLKGQLDSEFGDSKSFSVAVDTAFTIDSLKEAEWTLSLSAFSSDSIKKYEGTATFNIFAGEVTPVSINMNKLNGSAEITVILGDTLNLNDFLVVHYPFDSDVNDVSGNLLNGLFVSNSSEAYVEGINSNALLFDDQTKVLLDKKNEMETEEFTISLWAKFDSLRTERYQTLFCKYDGYNAGFRLTTRTELDTNHSLYTNLLFQIADENSSVHNIYFNTKANDTTRWYHIVVSAKDNGAVKLYIDGSLDTEYSFPHQWRSSASGGFSIGSTNNIGYEGYFYGKIDNIKFFNKAFDENTILSID